MDTERAPGNSFPDDASDELTELRVLEEKRRYIREYMRRWRSRPEHQQLEHSSRRRCYNQRKLQNGSNRLRCSTDPAVAPVCAICRKRPSVTTIVRLRLIDTAPYNYAEMRVPYCGEC